MTGFNEEKLDNLRKNSWSYPGKDGMSEEQAQQLKDNTEEISRLSSDIVDEVTNRENDIAEVKAQIIQQTPLFANSINECTDTSKVYVLPDGYIYAYMYVSGFSSENIMPVGSAQTKNGLTTTLDGNGGYVLNGTATASAVHKIFESESSFPNGLEKGVEYILIQKSGYIGTAVICYYNSSSELVDIINAGLTIDKEYSFTIPNEAVGLQIKYYPAVNYTYSNEVVKFECYESFEGYTFSNTGHAFVPADCEDRILALEKSITGGTSIPKPMLTIIDDDGYKKFTTLLLPIIQTKKVPIASAIPASYPNGESDYSSSAMTWEELETCYLNGAEILSHTYCHLSQTVAETMTKTEIQHDYQKAKNTFRNHGYSAKGLVFAGNSVSMDVCQDACKNVYEYGFKSYGDAINYRGNVDAYKIDRYKIEPTGLLTENSLKGLIDTLVSSGTGWMVWMIHTSDSGFQQTQADIISTVIDYAIEQGVEIVTTECGARHYI